MARRLVKIAKELNVGTGSLVDHLLKNGFEIENKPTAQVSDEMYEVLVREFQNSMAVKEQADQLIIGTRPSVKEEKTETSKGVSGTKTPLPPLVTKKKEAEAAAEAETPPPAEKVEEPKTVDLREESKPQIKVVGKIDLEKKKEAPVKKEVEEEKKETAEVKEEAAKEESVPQKAEQKAEESKEEENEMIRAEAPQLKGLKILGKIDTQKFDKPKKKKETPAAKSTSDDQEKKSRSRDDDHKKRRRRRTKVKTSRVGSDQRDRRGKKTEEVKEVSQKEIDEKIKATMARLSGGRQRKRQKIRRDKRDTMREKQELEMQEKETKAIQLTEFVTAQELANLMNVSVTDVITTCLNLGVVVSINQRLDAEIIELLAEEYGHEVEFISAEDETEEEEEIIDDPEDLKPRAPIVTVMGHVDHGKTSLLDYIRMTNVAGGEAGGITQHIGAYEVNVGEEDRKITFLDTPGHEAFTAMRARGAKATDIAVIIIAADDNIMPQTKEAISHAQAAGVPMVFAINKVDKDGADPERIKQQLASMNLLVESWGGKYQSQDISAKTGLNIDLLLEKIILEADLLELQANPDRAALGSVIEASLDKGRGYVCKLLVTNGTLSIGDSIVAGEHSGRVKAMYNERGKKVKVAGPSTPVLILGLSGAPQAGEKFKVTDTEQEARQIAAKRAQITREQTTRASKRISLDEIGRRLALGTFKELNLIVKGDVDGSIEALSDALLKLSQKTVQVNIIHKAVGQIIESDVLLASASDAIIIGFQVRPSMSARKLAEQEGVQIKLYSIIYEAIEEITAAIEGLLEPTKEEKIIGQMVVKETFKISKVGTIAGCFVEDGKFNRDTHVRVIRDGIVIYPTKEGVTGEISSLKRFKDDVKEVRSGLECGITIKNFNDIKVGDVIEGYTIIEIKQVLKT
ncbi:MAG: translation initiation factor IF-2 [Saprospiraceae bacterium]|nr:translation initiation factor IF-2 [Saprospiraceae bacterium]